MNLASPLGEGHGLTLSWEGGFDTNIALSMTSCSRVVKEANEESTERPNWLELPKEVTSNIFQKLGALEVLTSARQVCSLWWNISKEPLMWRTIDLTKPPHYPQPTLVNLCCYAIEQSCGHLEDISIEFFATDKVLKCIANNGSHLRRMRLVKCWAVSNKGLREAVIKLPLLEEFEISFNNVLYDTIAVMGQFCPLLKVLKLNMCPYKHFKYDDEALAIARNMPNLRHLQLMGNWLTNYGLIFILDSCLHLESLNLKACKNIDLSGSLGERCYKQIRECGPPGGTVPYDI
ncbi:putative F-box/LRR-repeat protein 9 [Lotus japonicus]|uniref:putative F-box/LRR-repeat protein 9 n=1 Tax=Lotus japonicus TaxID=34305 RepID=UPI002584F6BF|nr:putative F-box/LRR-repeat protein 9 [Lotus japonicus]